jgi:hypothetical protein
VLVAKLTRPGLHGVSVRVVGIRLGFSFRKLHDKHGNTNGDYPTKKAFRLTSCELFHFVSFLLLTLVACRIILFSQL